MNLLKKTTTKRPRKGDVAGTFTFEAIGAYRLTTSDLEDFLKCTFGEETELDIKLQGDNYVFRTPRALSPAERQSLLDKRRWDEYE